MKCWLYAEDKLIGWVNLLSTDRSMGVASGALNPTAEYERIRPLVREFLSHNGNLGELNNSHLDEIQAKLDALNFTAKTQTGILLHSVGIYFQDFMDELGEPCRVDV